MDKKKKFQKFIIAVIGSLALAVVLSSLITNFVLGLIVNKEVTSNILLLIKFPKDDLQLFGVITFLLTCIFVYLLYENERKYIKYDEYNVEIMKGMFIPKPIKQKVQYDSSWFLDKNKFEDTFSYNIVEANKLIKMVKANKKVDEDTFGKYQFESDGISLGLNSIQI